MEKTQYVPIDLETFLLRETEEYKLIVMRLTKTEELGGINICVQRLNVEDSRSLDFSVRGNCVIPINNKGDELLCDTSEEEYRAMPKTDRDRMMVKPLRDDIEPDPDTLTQEAKEHLAMTNEEFQE